MPTGLYADSTTPPSLRSRTCSDFIADEDKEFQASLARDRADIALWNQIQGFHEGALAEVQVHEDEILIFQILTFGHYHFLTATTALMRCHLSEMFGAVDRHRHRPDRRADHCGRGSQIAWVKRESPSTISRGLTGI